MVSLFPEIGDVSRFSHEGRLLVDDALICLFNAFDRERSGRVDFHKFASGL